jgi:hypothetical protein
MNTTHTFELNRIERNNNELFLSIKVKFNNYSETVLLLKFTSGDFIGSHTLFCTEDKEVIDYLIENNIIEIFETFLPQGEFGTKYTTHLIKLIHSEKLKLL